jgi:tRNA(fMet)-specific endonuclease VapC
VSAALFLADTNVLIDLVAGSDDALLARVQDQPGGAIVTSTLCVAEALFGAKANGQQIDLRRLLSVIPPLPFDLAAADAYTAVPFRPGRLDRLIAAHALALDLSIVTNNPTDFSDVPGLRIENWTR